MGQVPVVTAELLALNPATGSVISLFALHFMQYASIYPPRKMRLSINAELLSHRTRILRNMLKFYKCNFYLSTDPKGFYGKSRDKFTASSPHLISFSTCKRNL